MNDKITVEVSKDFLFETCALAHSRWSQEYDLMKKVKAETNDGSKDWEAFHAMRISNHTATLEKWNKLRLEAGELVHKLKLI